MNLQKRRPSLVLHMREHMRIGLLLCGASLSAGWLLSPAARVVVHAPSVRRWSSQVRCDEVTTLPAGWREVTDAKTGNPYYYNAATGVTQWQRPRDTFAGADGGSSTRLLTPATAWRVRLDLNSASCATPVSVTATLRFAEDDGYEPPQGKLLVESCVPEGAIALGEQVARWTLSEDPEDRKDSLWICTHGSDSTDPALRRSA